MTILYESITAGHSGSETIAVGTVNLLFQLLRRTVSSTELTDNHLFTAFIIGNGIVSFDEL
jgi:hypothetical protein